MSIAAKPIVAVTLLLGMTAVWVPRLTGFDPFGWLPEESSVPSSLPSSVPTSGAAPHFIEPEARQPVEPAFETRLSHEAERDAISLSSLKDVVQFLEHRTGGGSTASGRRDHEGAAQAPSEGNQTSTTPFISEALDLISTRPDSSVGEAPTALEALASFLTSSPLHTIICGNDLSTATFGNRRVEIGDALVDGRFEVLRINPEGVELDTPEGPRWAPLPPPGSSTYYRNPPTASQARQQDSAGEFPAQD